MASKSIVQKRISAGNLNQEQRILFADLIIQEIKKRTAQGIDKDGNRFPGYSDSYKNSFEYKVAGKSSKPNVKLSGDLLGSLEMIDEGVGFVIVGFDPNSEAGEKAEGNIIGSYGQPNGNPSKARNFLGLPERVLARLREQAGRGDIIGQVEESDSAFDAFLQGILRRENGDQ